MFLYLNLSLLDKESYKEHFEEFIFCLREFKNLYFFERDEISDSLMTIFHSLEFSINMEGSLDKKKIEDDIRSVIRFTNNISKDCKEETREFVKERCNLNKGKLKRNITSNNLIKKKESVVSERGVKSVVLYKKRVGVSKLVLNRQRFFNNTMALLLYKILEAKKYRILRKNSKEIFRKIYEDLENSYLVKNVKYKNIIKYFDVTIAKDLKKNSENIFLIKVNREKFKKIKSGHRFKECKRIVKEVSQEKSRKKARNKSIVRNIELGVPLKRYR